MAASAPATPGRSVSGGVSTVPSKRSVLWAVVALAEREHEHQAAGEDQARRGHPSRRKGTRSKVALLPRRRGGDDGTLLELDPRLHPPVLADAAREDLNALAARLEDHVRHALRVDRRSHERRRRQLEDDLALRDAVVVFGRERNPVEHVVPGLSLHDAVYDVFEDEGVRRISAWGESPPDAHLRPIPHFDLSGLVAKRQLPAIHLGADDLDVVGTTAREIAEDVVEGAAFETKDHGLDDLERAA